MTTTTDKLFEELRTEAIKIWKTYDDTYGYATEKIEYINSLSNIGDNYGTFIGMFDNDNQQKLFNNVSSEAKKLITDWTGGYVR
jgi:hypothetical protein